MNSPIEVYSLAGVALAVVAILSLFVRSLVKRQDQMFTWFTGKLNGSLDALKQSIEGQKHATEHNTKNLKTIQELFATALEHISSQVVAAQEASVKTTHAKLDELLERDRTKHRAIDDKERA